MHISLFHSFFLHKFFIFNNNFWTNNLEIETIRIIPVSYKNNPISIINMISSTKPFYASLNSLHKVYFFTKFIKKNKSYKFIFLIFRFKINIKYLNSIIFDIIFFWKNFNIATNKIFKFFKNSSNLNYFLLLNDTKRTILKYSYINFFFLDFYCLITNIILIFNFRQKNDFLIFINFFKTLLFEGFFFKKRFINEKT